MEGFEKGLGTIKKAMSSVIKRMRKGILPAVDPKIPFFVGGKHSSYRSPCLFSFQDFCLHSAAAQKKNLRSHKQIQVWAKAV